MITNGSHSRLKAIGATIQFLVRSKWIFSLAIAALVTVAATLPPPVSDENTDEEYIRVMNLMDRADALRAAGKEDAAKAKDQEAYRALIIFQKTHPKWNSKTVEYRLNQIAQEIEGRPKESEEPTKSKGHTNLEAPSKHTSSQTMSSAGATFKLVDAGAEPRKALRLHVKAGDKQSIILTVKRQEAADARTGGLPDISFPADTTVQSVAANGDIAYETVFGTPSLVQESNAPPQMAQQTQELKTGLAGFNGLTISAVVSDRGIGKKSEMRAGAAPNLIVSQISDQIKDVMSGIILPFPEEAIGAGSKWEVKMTTKSGGVSMTRLADYQLVSMDGDHVSASITMSASAPEQKIQNPALPSVQIHLLEATNSGNGTVALNLSKLVPLQFSMDTHTEMKGDRTMGGKTEPLDSKIAQNIGVEAQ